MLYVAIAVLKFCPAQLTSYLPILDYWSTFCVSCIARVRTGRLVVDTRLQGILLRRGPLQVCGGPASRAAETARICYALQVVNSGVNSVQTNVSF